MRDLAAGPGMRRAIFWLRLCHHLLRIDKVSPENYCRDRVIKHGFAASEAALFAPHWFLNHGLDHFGTETPR